MSEIVDAEFEEVGTDLVPVQNGTLFRTDDPAEIVVRATEIADTLAAVIRSKQLTVNIKGKEYAKVEAWTLLGTMLGVFPVVEWTRPVADGWEARVEARTLAGQVVGAAEAECLRTERMWKDRDDYALRSMAQTRATSKALRGPLGFVVTLAGYEATPAEEMPADGLSGGSPAEDDDTEKRLRERRVEGPKPVKAPKSWAALTQLVASYDKGTHDTFFAFADAARRLLFPEAESTKALNKQDKDFLFQKTVGAAVHLREQFEPTEMPPPSVEDLRACFARVLDGQELALEGEE